MNLIGLMRQLQDLLQSKTVPGPTWNLPQGTKAEHHLSKPKPATPERKRRRQMVQASQRRNR